MNAKKWFLAVMMISGACIFSVAYAETLTKLTNEDFIHPHQPFVPFLHDEHNENAGLDDNCAFCHHVYEDGQLVEDESSEDMACAECHMPVNFSENVSLTAAFHRRCKGCHLSVRKGPIVCGQCHSGRDPSFSALP